MNIRAAVRFAIFASVFALIGLSHPSVHADEQGLTTAELEAVCHQDRTACGEKLNKILDATIQLGELSGSKLVCIGPQGRPSTDELIGLFLAEEDGSEGRYDAVPAGITASKAFRSLMPCTSN